MAFWISYLVGEMAELGGDSAPRWDTISGCGTVSNGEGNGMLEERMTQNILLAVAGLPGSGKTTYLSELAGIGWLCFDDFKNMAVRNSRQFRHSPHFATLLARLREGVNCAVTDIDFCRTESRAEASDVLRTELPNVEICWLFFSHTVEDCAANIVRRGRRSVREDLGELSRYSACYQIPHGAQERPCYRIPSELRVAAGAQKEMETGIVQPGTGELHRTCS